MALGALVGRAEVLDETLRDGIQCPSVVDPPIDDKIEILHLMDELGIDARSTSACPAPARAPART